MADRKQEWPAVVDLLAGRLRERILLFEGPTGYGKSELLHQAVNYAKMLEMPVVRIDFKGGGLNLSNIFGEFDLELGEHLPNFSRQGAEKIHLLRKDLRALRQPILLLFDTYEMALENNNISTCIEQQLLMEVETSLSLAVIVVGQKVPHFGHASWRNLSRHYRLQPITETEYWEPWIARRYPNFGDKGAHLHTILLWTKGVPSAVSGVCETISNS